ncbi:hypothetical protein BVY03_00225 [bacterium K02(2017)]|nr:hypothetical protein BVY03_00225 [bacterium K02(2017)]
MSFEINDEKLKVLKTVVRHAGEDASQMFTKWLRSDVTIKMDEINLVSFESIFGSLTDAPEVSVGLYMSTLDGVEGGVLFLFSEPVALNIVDMLIKKELGTSKEFTELEKSALKETANIVGCAYINSLGKNLELKITPSQPIFIHDMTEAIFGSVLMEQAQYQNEALFIKTELNHKGSKLDFQFYFLPLIEKLSEKL